MLSPSVPETLHRQFSLSDIKSATNNFSGHLIIGKGAFGNVYRAKTATGTVAVKRRDIESKQDRKEFLNELSLLSVFRHAHLISLIGYCDDLDANEMIIVYEYMANGTLADHIYKKSGNSCFLSWEQRLKICIGVGRGLEYLHTGTGINEIVIHRDVKSSNILLDENWEPRISDFGLCKKCVGNQPDTPIVASVKGTRGYMDPHYRKTGELSTKTDVYSFGVVLLEVLCGRRPLDFVVSGRQKWLVSWAQQCIREGVAHRVIDRGLRGRIADDGLRIFQDITLQCLHERPDKRPTMAEVVAKLEAALKSQFTTYSSSSEDDEFIKIFFGQVSNSSSYSNSDADSHRRTVEIGSGKSDTTKHDPDSESNTTAVRRSKSSYKYSGLDVPGELRSISETSNGVSELDKLARRMNPPSVVVDNESCANATVIEVNGASTLGVLLELLQVLTDFDLKITKFSRTNDGSWFMDVFYVIGHGGNKITDEDKIQSIKEALHVYLSSTPYRGRKCNERPIPYGHTTLELIGNDRPGLISELSAIISDLQCNVVTAEIWTHNTRLAAVMHVSDKQTKSAIIEPEKLSKIKKVLLIVLQGGHDNREAMIRDSNGCTWIDRKLHQIMSADKYFEPEPTLNDKRSHKLDVVSWNDDNYSAISIWCKHTPKVLFDTICTLTELGYFVFHGNFYADGAKAYQMEFWIRHIDGSPFKSDAETQKVIQFLEAAIERRVSTGLKIEIRTKDRVGLLSDVTRIMRENSLNITRAEIATTGDKAVFSFHLDDNLGYPVDPKIIDYVRKEIGENILQVKGNRKGLYQAVEESFTRSSFKDALKTFLSWLRFSEHQVSFLPS
ncbi:putative protein kinase RLK-Pelle-CrRLK1L-1 family [Helianthus annuus]|nr:putative protein kinase RLK-Pelle-CrRLK1L-1 family [Helianthus annuus]